MQKQIFISYDFNDASFKGEVESWLTEAGLYVFSINRSELGPEPIIMAKNRMKEQINQSCMLLVLVGNNTHNRTFLNYEVAVAKSKQIPVRWIRLSGRNGAPPPEIQSVSGIEYGKFELFKLLITLGIIKH